MIKKRETCLYCDEKMESITAKKKFCSNKCRVYWNRENKILKRISGATKQAVNPPDTNLSKKEKPEGMGRIETMRWLRENQ